MTKDEILEEIEINKNVYFYLKEPNKYAEVYLKIDSSTYDKVSVNVKNNSQNKYVTNKNNKNENYIVKSIRGLMYFNEDLDSCMQKRDEIVTVLSNIFPNITKLESIYAHPSDLTGDSISSAILFYNDEVLISQVTCLDLEETHRIKNNWNDFLQVSLYSEEIVDWLESY